VLLAEIAVPVPLGQAFSYSIPHHLERSVVPGVRVLCDFAHRRMLGVVLAVGDRAPPVDASKIKPVVAVVDAQPILEDELLGFLRELAAYYLSPIGEVIRLALPAVERTQKKELEQADLGFEGSQDAPLVGRTVGGRARLAARATGAEVSVKLGKTAKAVLDCLKEEGETHVAELEREWKGARAAVERLVELGAVETFMRQAKETPFFAEPVPRDDPPALTDAQNEAMSQVVSAIRGGGSRSFLLHGVTGSGKTEVYLRCIAVCLALGRGALVLVPEIALTPQLVARFRARFGDGLAVLHSGLTDRERHAMWTKLRDGSVLSAIGARSALFAPVRRLGLVIVDEEHDGSFKQEEGVRYHARDMALYRAYRAGAVAVVGSATPSIETEMRAREGKLTRLSLPERAHAAAVLPAVELVDLRRMGPGPTRDPMLSLPLHRAIERTLEAKEQVILFLNRRGFAPSVVCEGCGAILKCQACSVALTFHRARGGRLRCHYCDFASSLSASCPACAGRLVLEGLGTEKLEVTVAAAFPSARVARLDRDVASGDRAERVLSRMRALEIDILVGTQMVTKGHDLPRVTLVGVVNADAALAMPDYRAAERTFQLLVQVAGRAGRRDRPGLVVIQTRDPEHPAIAAAAHHDVAMFFDRELADRKELGYPPFSHLALLRLDAADEGRVTRASRTLATAALATSAGQSGTVEVLGPAPAPIARLRGRFRYRVLLRAKDRRALRATLLALVPTRDRMDRAVRIAIDVDPVQMM
jgi:primosomal protein N' (replication factor Y) (superfamily II helicase)